jgi:outer membrane protein OmpA-like peptidoglycan-associated protein
MSYRPFRNIGRCLLAACAVSLGVSSLSAQTAPSTTAPAGTNPSRVDIFLGYSYFGAHGQVKPAGLKYSSIDVGAIGSGAYYFNKYVGAELIGVSHPSGQNDQFFSISAGPIFRAPMQNYTLFAHALAGGGKLGGPNNETPALLEHEPSMWGPTLTVGGGMDYDLPFFNHKFGLRLFEADYRYVHADYGNPVAIPTTGTLGGRANIGAAELSTGLLMHFGHILPPPAVTYACSVTAPTADIYPGDPVTVTGTATNLNPKKTASYSWASPDAGTISSSSNVVTVDTKSLAAGTYTVKGHVSDGAKPYEIADCSTQFVVKPFLPPTIGCSANPSTINVGDSSTITAAGMSPQSRPLTYSYSATAGQISGSTATATLTTTGVAPGTITVTCNVVDDKGQTASQMTTVTVAAPAVAPAKVTTTNLCTVSFGKKGQPAARVDNEAKACLDDIALNAQRDPSAKLAIAGNSTSGEKMSKKLAAERAVNTKAYLVTDKGVDASRISVYTGSADAETAQTTLIPAGATLDTTGLTAVDESAVKAQPRTPLHTAKKKHKK